MLRNWGTGRWMSAVLVALAVIALGVRLWNGKLSEIQLQALRLDNAMHAQMASGDLAEIYNGADEQYRNSVTRNESDALFMGIARKLGTPLDCVQGGTNLSFKTEGTKLTSVCETHFSKNAMGEETFTWLKTGDTYSLLNYNLSSADLLKR